MCASGSSPCGIRTCTGRGVGAPHGSVNVNGEQRTLNYSHVNPDITIITQMRMHLGAERGSRRCRYHLRLVWNVPPDSGSRESRKTRRRPKVGSGGTQDDVLAGQDDGEQGTPRGTHHCPGMLSLGEILAAALSRRAGSDAAATEAMYAESYGEWYYRIVPYNFVDSHPPDPW